ncbi:hypothetical protein GC163_01500 [bacterium]|nr:hypothetical protein [bacterium]
MFTFANFLKKRSAKRQASVTSYLEVLLKLVSGEEVTEKVAESAIEASGRTVEQAEADYRILKARFDAVEDIRQADAMQPELDAARAAHVASVEAVTVAQKQAEKLVEDAMKAMNDASWARTNIEHRQRDLRSKAREFLKATSDKSIWSRVAEIDRRIESLTNTMNDISMRLTKLKRETVDHVQIPLLQTEYDRQAALKAQASDQRQQIIASAYEPANFGIDFPADPMEATNV